MKDILSVENMRNSDAAAIEGGVAQSELMSRAGRAIYESVDWKSPVAIICGKGNNGGDGYELAKLFDKDGTKYRIIDVFGTDDAVPDLSAYATIVDCIFGTGFRGEVTGHAADMISAINASGAYVVSVDINSGLNGDNGLYGPAGAHDADQVNSQCVISDLTVSIGSWQPGHFLGSAKDVMKNKVNCDIGIKPVGEVYHLFEMSDAAELFAPRKNNSNKGSYGYIALIGGSSRYGGAIKLAAMANAAMRSGAGVVQLAVPKGLCASIRPEILESTLFPLSDNDCDLVFKENEFRELISRVDVIAFGMGIGRSQETLKALKYILENYEGTLIIDADGLNMLSELLKNETGCLHQTKCKDIILTPHPKEFSRLSGRSVEEILHNPIEEAEAFAKANGVTVLLKGSSTIVTDGEEVYICERGCAGMATAGSGDVLSGVLAAICGSNKESALLSASAAAYTAGLAGELAQEETGAVGMLASDTVRYLPQAIKKEANIQKPLQKAISFTVPCYNSAAYMDNCIQSLIDLNSGYDDIEIIIVDDGSNEDNTLEKALWWEKKYPTTVRVIHQENGGPGQAINTGLKNAKGLYFKVVDSDDYLDKQGSAPVLDYIRRQVKRACGGGQATDMIIGNYVYNKVTINKLTPINYTDALPENREFTWNDIKRFKMGEYLFMHSIIYRTQLLHDISLELPKHTFYVDSIVVCYPLPYVKSAYYINTNMYMYYIGREDQSVNEEVIVSRVDQVIRVAKIVIDTMDIKKLKTMPKLEQYYFHQIAQMMSVCTVILRMINTSEAKAKLKDIWDYLKKTDKHVYFSVFRSPLCWGTNIPGKFGRAVCLGGYKAAKKIIPFT